VPLAVLKKQKFGYTVHTNSLSEMEVATLSLTKLQHAAPIKGLVYNFLNSPLLGTHVHPHAMMPRFPSAVTGFLDFHVTQALPLAFSTAGPMQAHTTPSDIDVQVPVAISQSPKPASVAATKKSPSHRFFRANRGRHGSASTIAGSAGQQPISACECLVSTPTSQENTEECPMRPPPHA
jgi:hypothetical protein